MINKYKIDDHKTTELLKQYPLERIEAVMRKIDYLTKINSWTVDNPKKRSNHFIECVEKNLTEVNQII